MKNSLILKVLLILEALTISVSEVKAQTLKPLVYGSQSGPEKGTSPFVQIEVDTNVYNVVNSWDKKIWLFTSKDNPLKSFEGLQQKDIAAWGLELMQRVQNLYKALGIKETGVNLIGTGNPIFSGMENPPRLFITWSGQESNLPGAIRIELKEENPPPTVASLQSSITATVVAYKGVHECDGLRSEVSFVYDTTTMTIRNFVLEFACIDGKGLKFRSMPVDIKVGNDGSFYYQAPNNRFLFIKGRIFPDGKAEGEHDKRFVSTGCGNIYNPLCVKWAASPTVATLLIPDGNTITFEQQKQKNDVSDQVKVQDVKEPKEDITFGPFTGETKITIYNLRGDKLRMVKTSDTTWTWDKLNNKGMMVERGLYIYTIVDSRGYKTIGKVMVY
ncbi:MAG: hypothetical protein H8D45_02275 [Bacteroidetes bacterium]|nr:hypothetical protein [Bacteroidota bacterium]